VPLYLSTYHAGLGRDTADPGARTVSALAILLGAESKPPQFEALLVEAEWVGGHAFDLALKITGGDGPITPAAQVPAAGANPHADTPLRTDPQHSRPDLRPQPLRYVRLHTLAFYGRDLGPAIVRWADGHGTLVQEAG
jgi:hypothetical protein